MIISKPKKFGTGRRMRFLDDLERKPIRECI